MKKAKRRKKPVYRHPRFYKKLAEQAEQAREKANFSDIDIEPIKVSTPAVSINGCNFTNIPKDNPELTQAIIALASASSEHGTALIRMAEALSMHGSRPFISIGDSKDA